MGRVMEMELPLGDRPEGELARRRIDQLRRMLGDDHDALVRLLASFPNLRAIYAASDADLTRVLGPIAAARVRWFLDAPLAMPVELPARDARSEGLPEAA